MTGERESRDLKRAREYIEHALTGVRVHVPQYAAHYWNPDGTGMADGANIPANLTEALFGAYTCRRCSSYLHDEAAHGAQQ